MVADKRWRKVTRKHPGKKWDAARVLIVYDNGFVDTLQLPRFHWKNWWTTMTKYHITHWMPFPAPPEEVSNV